MTVINLKSRSREITILALLAGLNAVLELTLGNYLHYVKFPLVGSIMVGINVIVYVAGYSRVPRRGTILTIGFITAVLNLFFGGSFKPWSIVAIFLEALLIEAVISPLGLKFWTVLLASVVSNLFSLFYTITVVALVMKKGFAGSMSVVLQRFMGSVENLTDYVIGAGVIVVMLHLVIAAIFAGLAWKIHNITQVISNDYMAEE
ncbi:MAG: hypothetical protein ACLFQV_06775 [Vulcanimicrobiota bacterium]